MSQGKILVVEDDPDISDLLRIYFESEGYSVALAGRGEDALDMCGYELPTVIVLDIMLPDMDGYEVCRRLRADPKTAELPVLMFSAKGTGADRNTGLQVGANDFIVKSAGPRALVARVRSLLSEPLTGADGVPLPVPGS